MDASTYYDGRDDGDYIARGPDETSYFTNPSGGYTTLPGATYPIGGGHRPNMDQRDSGFSLDFLPTGDTLPRAYPGTIDPSVTTSPNPTFDMDSSQAFCDRDSSEDMRLSQYGAQSMDGYTFLPSPPDADESIEGNGAPAEASRQRKKSNGSTGSRKRRHHQSSAANGTKGEKNGSDEKRQTRPTTQLRTASRAPKRYSQATARKPAESPEEVKARAAHNQVEQQYRKRLNQQFERLLAVLPQPNYDEDAMEGEDGGDGGGRAGMEKRISKAEVLDLARRRIKVLERERSTLEKQKRDLLGNVGRLQDEWTRRLGTTVPTKTER